MLLYLCRLKHEGSFKYKLFSDSSRTTNLTLDANMFSIECLIIDASIYTPLTIKATCIVSEPIKNKFIPYYSVYGVMFKKEYTYDERGDCVLSASSCCLFTNSFKSYLPFVVTEVEFAPEKSQVIITLIEKRAFLLATTHSFVCLGQGKESKKDGAQGLLSIAEVVEKLSTINEDESGIEIKLSKLEDYGTYFRSLFELNEIKEENSKHTNIFSFDTFPVDPETKEETKGINYKESTCAFVSRFIATQSQSRLEIILSLMHKWGYGLVYRMSDRQYYAVDLLSNYAPGFHTGKLASDVNGCYPDRYYFAGKTADDYFCHYAPNYLNIVLNYDRSYIEDLEFDKNGNEYHYFSHDFADFFQNRLLISSSKASAPKFYTAQPGSANYFYLSRYSPISSASCLLSKSDLDNAGQEKNETDCVTIRPEFDLSSIIRIGKKNISRAKKAILLKNINAIESVMLQNNRYTHQQGGQRTIFEDQVELKNNKDASLSRNNEVLRWDFDKIKTPNQRLAYAKYKLDHMQRNYFTQAFELKNNIGLSYMFNIVYELLNWLGVHTDLFQQITKSYYSLITRRKFPSPSGAKNSIKGAFKLPADCSERAKKLYLFYRNNGDFADNYYLYRDNPVLFGKLHIQIRREGIKGRRKGNGKGENWLTDTSERVYCISPTLTFFSDIVDYNIGTEKIMYNTKTDNKVEEKKTVDYGDFFTQIMQDETYEGEFASQKEFLQKDDDKFDLPSKITEEEFLQEDDIPWDTGMKKTKNNPYLETETYGINDIKPIMPLKKLADPEFRLRNMHEKPIKKINKNMNFNDESRDDTASYLNEMPSHVYDNEAQVSQLRNSTFSNRTFMFRRCKEADNEPINETLFLKNILNGDDVAAYIDATRLNPNNSKSKTEERLQKSIHHLDKSDGDKEN